MNLKKVSLENIENSVAILSFFHPKANALDKEILEELTKIFYELEKNKKVKVILFSSANETVFSSGLFLDELDKAENQVETQKIFSRFAHLIFSMIRCSKLILGVFSGKAIGGGVGLLAACDYVFGQSNAQIRLSELSIGISPLLIEPIISKKIGVSSFLEIALNPKSYFDASWARQKGLINKIMIEKKEPSSFAKEFSNYSEEAFYELKKIRWKDRDQLEKLMEERVFTNAKLWFGNKNKKNDCS